jgi:hypothetical protein
MKKIFKLILFAPVFFLAGCGNPLGGNNSIVQANHDPGVSSNAGNSLAPANGSEFVAASAQNVKTLNNRFEFAATLGSPSSQIVQTTTTRNYTLWSNVQGELISNGL